MTYINIGGVDIYYIVVIVTGFTIAAVKTIRVCFEDLFGPEFKKRIKKMPILFICLSWIIGGIFFTIIHRVFGPTLPVTTNRILEFGVATTIWYFGWEIAKQAREKWQKIKGKRAFEGK